MPTAYASLCSDLPGEVISAAVAIGIPKDANRAGLIMEYSAKAEEKIVVEQVKKMVRAQLDTLRWIKTQRAEVVPFLQKFYGLDEGMALESHTIYAKLIIDDARPLAEAVKTVLDQQGKPDLPLDRVVDASVVEEVLRERK